MDERIPTTTESYSERTESRAELPTLADSIRLAAEESAADQEAIFRDLRQRRQLNTYDRDKESIEIDDAIIELLESGDSELAGRLITPSPNEITLLERAVARHYDDDEALSAMTTINEIVSQKIEAFSKQLRDHLAQLDPGTVGRLVAEIELDATNPESALEVPPTFWANFSALPDDTRFIILRTPSSIGAAVDALEVLGQSGLLGYVREFLVPAAALPAADCREYVLSASEAMRTLKADYPNVPLGRFEISILASHREPAAALDLAVRSFPDMQPTVALSFLNSELGMDLDSGNAPTDLPAEITAILPDLNDAFRKAGVSSYEAPLLVREALELGPEAIHTIFPNFIKLMRETADFREKINTSFGMVNESINERRIDALHFYEDEFRAILLPENKLDEGETGRRLDRFAMKQYAANKHYELIKVFLEEIRDEERGDAKPPEPDTYPSTADRIKNRGLDKYFDELGIPEGLRTKLFDAWMSYSAIGHALRQYEKSQVKDLTDEEIEMASLQAARIFYEQLTAMQHYCEQYGSAELIELNEIFGIVDFTRGSAEQFHDQLLRWRNPELSVKNINVAATEDHNFAFGNTANLFFTSFGEDGSFYFEASSIPELSRAFVRVGTRERSVGREPIENSEVRNVVISGHGGPKGIALSRGNSVNIENFAQAAQGRHQLIDRHGNARPNDYSQHIGMSYRVILHACSAGKEVPESINLSQVLHREYGVPIEASSRVMAGYRVSEAGNIMYRVPGENGEYVYSDGVRYE